MEHREFLTLGHSTHSWEYFAKLLQMFDVTAIADVRSYPFSRHNPHFNQDTLKGALRDVGVAYVFMGAELGGRPKGENFYCDGVADYEKMAEQENFRHGLDRIIKGATQHRIALLCSEHDPLQCHRCLLVGRELSKRSYKVRHVLSDASIQDHEILEERLLQLTRRTASDMFLSRDLQLVAAYREWSRKIAYSVSSESRKAAE
jgi:uncharacterized protein (DUF488 family)